MPTTQAIRNKQRTYNININNTQMWIRNILRIDYTIDNKNKIKFVGALFMNRLI